MSTALMRGLLCPLRISNCNNRFTKVKFRLKTTQLKTVFSILSTGKIIQNCPRGGISWGKIVRELVVQGNYSRAIVGKLFGSNFLVGKSPGVIVLVGIPLGRLFVGQLPRGNFHWTTFPINSKYFRDFLEIS